ncbi:MAG TPA: hypothetical protein VKR58_04275 [Aquella sp.]|nr:hypothetical protein [Aquella sp.]
MTLDLTKPIQTRDGRKVRILCNNLKGKRPIAAAIQTDLEEDVVKVCINGKIYGRSGTHMSDLINIPEGDK